MKRKWIPVLAALIEALWRWTRSRRSTSRPRRRVPGGNRDVGAAIARRAMDEQVQGAGRVVKLLPDDTIGSRHQRFLVRLAGGESLLVAHNLDVGRRVEPLREGDAVEFAGEYQWNDKGGFLHWTHHDPAGRHEPGWIRRRGVLFE